MPPTAAAGVKKWGQADKDRLNSLINRQLINITDTSLSNIEQVRQAHFCHCDIRNFRQKFCNFAAAWALEIEYSGARRREHGGKLRCLISANIFIIYLRLGWQCWDLCLSATPPKRQTFVSVANMLTMSAQHVGNIIRSRPFFRQSCVGESYP